MDKNLQKILDNIVSYDYAKLFREKNTKIKIQKDKKLGIKLVCVKPIEKGETIAYYKFMVYKDDISYKPYRDNMYAMSVETKNGKISNRLIGDIYPGSLQYPGKDGIPYYAFFSNEPTPKQRENCRLDPELKRNYANRKVIRAGDTMIYSLKATCDIKKGEPITWCYGSLYERDYEINPSCLE